MSECNREALVCIFYGKSQVFQECSKCIYISIRTCMSWCQWSRIWSRKTETLIVVTKVSIFTWSFSFCRWLLFHCLPIHPVQRFTIVFLSWRTNSEDSSSVWPTIFIVLTCCWRNITCLQGTARGLQGTDGVRSILYISYATSIVFRAQMGYVAFSTSAMALLMSSGHRWGT